MNAVNQSNLVEVQHETNGNVEELHVGKQSCLVHWDDGLNRLDLNQQARLHEEIESEGLGEPLTFIVDDDVLLANGVDSPELQLAQQALLVNAFQQTRPKDPVDLNRSTNDFPAQPIRFFIARMHGTTRKLNNVRETNRS